MNENEVAITVFEAFYRDVSSDDFKCYGPGDDDNFYLHHKESGKRYKIQVTEDVT